MARVGTGLRGLLANKDTPAWRVGIVLGAWDQPRGGACPVRVRSFQCRDTSPIRKRPLPWHPPRILGRGLR